MLEQRSEGVDERDKRIDRTRNGRRERHFVSETLVLQWMTYPDSNQYNMRIGLKLDFFSRRVSNSLREEYY